MCLRVFAVFLRALKAAKAASPHPQAGEQGTTDGHRVLGKVISGDADAGFIDVKIARSKVSGVTFPESPSAVNGYTIVVLKVLQERRSRDSLLCLQGCD